MIQWGLNGAWDSAFPAVPGDADGAGPHTASWELWGLLFFICPILTKDPFSTLSTVEPGHSGTLAYRWIGPMGGLINGLNHREAAAGDQKGGRREWSGISSFPDEPYYCLQFLAGDLTASWLPGTLSSIPMSWGRIMSPQTCPHPNLCNLWIWYFTWQRGLWGFD